MAVRVSASRFTPTFLLYLPFLLSSVSCINVTHLLSAYPAFSAFSGLLASTAVAADLASRSSITVLAVPDAYLRATTASLHPAVDLSDVLRYHILLEYLSFSDLRRVPPTGKLVTTLFQTTGRAAANSGTVNITFDSSSSAVTFHSPASNATLLSQIEIIPYNLSIMSLDSLLIPYVLDLMTSETRPPLGLNITKALIDGHDFNVAAAMLDASGVVSEFEADEGGAGITMFIPIDEAFADLPLSIQFQSLPADIKAVVLRFHVLHSYYPLGSLESIVNPVQPTLATEQNGAGSFTLNISRVNGSVGINTGIVQASVTQTVFDQNPVSIFGVSKVLLPRELFGNNPIEVDDLIQGAAPPDSALPPDSSVSLPIHASDVPRRGILAIGGVGLSLGFVCIAVIL